MNRQEAIQDQIDQILDMFDFQSALKALEVYKSSGCGYSKDWECDGEFQEYLLRKAARDCMKASIKEGYAGHSYFTSYFHEGEDEDGPWVKIDLLFGDRSYNDGTSYEKTTTTTASI